MEKKNVVLLSVIAVATLLTAVVGATFAYFSATVQTVGETKETVIKTANTTAVISYTDGAELNTESTPIAPGWTGSKTFEVANTGTKSAVYNVQFTGFSNSIDSNGTDGTPTEEFYYTMSCTASGSTSGDVTEAAVTKTLVPYPGNTTETIKTGITLDAGETHTCTINFTFENLETVAQDYNQGKAFRGTLNVTVDNISE